MSRKRKTSLLKLNWFANRNNEKGGNPMDTQSLAHSKWNCKYHIVFAAKYRRQAIYGKIKKDIGVILRKLTRSRVSK